MRLSAAVISALFSLTASAPCDIYDSVSTPCVAAHSVVRPLYRSYNGPLYEIIRLSDNDTSIIQVDPTTRFAQVNHVADFCGTAGCTVSTIYDQSPFGNHLHAVYNTPTVTGANATKAQVIVGGALVYGAYMDGYAGYTNNVTSGIATGNEPESMYMVVAGDHYSPGCCFDYGNAEVDHKADGDGSMEAVYWGSNPGFGHGAGDGPWVLADLEKGLWAGPSRNTSENYPSVKYDFVTAMLKGKGKDFALKVADASQEKLTTVYEGPRNSSYATMRKQGAIVLGLGGDLSYEGAGTFFEGVMTRGYTPNEADRAVQADIASVGYAKL